MARVIISAGHTKDNPGISIDNLEEYSLAKEISSLITSRLRNEGFITLSVPVGIGEDQKIKWVNTTGYNAELDDILIEIHFHADTKSGVKVWFNDSDTANSEKIARKINESLSNDLKVKTITIASQQEYPKKSLSIITKTKTKSVVVECLSLDNEKDRSLLENKQTLKQIADSISSAILSYFGNNQPNSTPSINKGAGFMPAAEIKNQNKITSTPIAPSTQKPITSPKNDPFDIGDDPFGLPKSTLNSIDSSSNSGKKMTREERKEMINKYYKKAFGQEPETGDLNYFLNIGISEEQLLKRILESEEHKEQVESAIKYKEIKSKHDKISNELNSLKNNLEDQKKILDKLNNLLDQKNKYLSKLQQRVQILLSRVEEYRNSQGEVREKVDYKQNTIERIFSFLASKLS